MGIRPMVMYVTRSVYFDTYWKCLNQKQVKRIRVLLREAVEATKLLQEGTESVCFDQQQAFAVVNMERGLLKVEKMRYYAPRLEIKKTISVYKRTQPCRWKI